MMRFCCRMLTSTIYDIQNNQLGFHSGINVCCMDRLHHIYPARSYDSNAADMDIGRYGRQIYSPQM